MKKRRSRSVPGESEETETETNDSAAASTEQDPKRRRTETELSELSPDLAAKETLELELFVESSAENLQVSIKNDDVDLELSLALPVKNDDINLELSLALPHVESVAAVKNQELVPDEELDVESEPESVSDEELDDEPEFMSDEEWEDESEPEVETVSETNSCGSVIDPDS